MDFKTYEQVGSQNNRNKISQKSLYVHKEQDLKIIFINSCWMDNKIV